MTNNTRLNEQQKAAVEHFNGPCLVTASPGSGKTFTLAERVVRLVARGISPENLLCITFTNKAGNEMRERIFKKLGGENSKFFIGTFHAFCAFLLRKCGSRTPYGPNFTILDSNDQMDLMIQMGRRLGVEKKDKRINFWKVINNLNLGRENYETFEQMDHRFNNAFLGDTLPWKLVKNYLNELEHCKFIDFSGLLYEAVSLLEKDPEVLDKVRKRYQYIQADEVQDTNLVQFKLIDLLGGDKKNVLIVGDLDQSIYGFRGARQENITDFIAMNPSCVKLSLPLNYRSTPEIASAGQYLIENNPSHMGDKIETQKSSGSPVVVSRFFSPQQEASNIALTIMNLKEQGIQGSEIAIFYRINALSQAIETAFSQHGLKYTVIGGMSFYDRKEIRDCLSMLRFIFNPFDSVAFSRCAKLVKGIGEKTIGRIEALASKNKVSILNVCRRIKPTSNSNLVKGSKAINKMFGLSTEGKGPGELLNEAVSKTGYLKYLAGNAKDDADYQDRKENVEQLIASALSFSKEKKQNDIAGYLQNISLVTSSDKSASDDSVSMMTIHAAKGLEFDTVFIVGVEKDLMPHVLAMKEAKNEVKQIQAIEEERRIFYVGITRAKSKLYISHCATRQRRGKGGAFNTKPSSPSFFIEQAGLVTDGIMAGGN